MYKPKVPAGATYSHLIPLFFLIVYNGTPTTGVSMSIQLLDTVTLRDGRMGQVRARTLLKPWCYDVMLLDGSRSIKVNVPLDDIEEVNGHEHYQ